MRANVGEFVRSVDTDKVGVGVKGGPRCQPRGGGSSFGSEREAGGSTISHGAASLVRMGRGGARRGLRFGAGAGASSCECWGICEERGHRQGGSGG